MSVIFILLSISIAVAASFLGAFLWAIKSGQYDDDYTPAVRILFDDNQQKKNKHNQTTKSSKL
jgi:cbb3-type cytochrome oxidase maturation protein